MGRNAIENYFIVVLAVYSVSGSSLHKDEVIFYEDTNYEGDRLFIKLGTGCYTMEDDWDSRISSVDTNGHCITVWEYEDCRGQSVRLTQGVLEGENLDRLKFNDAISSISPCRYKPRRVGSSRSRDEKDIWKVGLQVHNRYRRMHGVQNLLGDAELHEEAQLHANYLARNNKFETSEGTEFGENLGTSYEKDKLDAIRDVVGRWYDKIEYYNFRDPESNKNRPKSGQFSSIIWKSTTHLGVGVAFNRRDRKWIIVCMYSPPATTSHYTENVPPSMKSLEEEVPHLLTT